MSEITMAAPATAGTAVPWGARAAVAAPVVAVFGFVVGLPTYTDDLSEVAGSARWVLATTTALAALLLLALGLLGLYVRQAHAFGTLGHAGAVLALLGTILAAGGAWDSVFTVPYLAEHAPAVLDRATDGSLLAGYVSSYLVFALGWGAFAVATLRARVLPRGASITLLVGAVLAILPAPTSLRVLVLAIACALLSRRPAR
jgi:hypothetical protein